MDVSTQQIIDFINESVAMDQRPPEDQMEDTIPVKPTAPQVPKNPQFISSTYDSEPAIPDSFEGYTATFKPTGPKDEDENDNRSDTSSRTVIPMTQYQDPMFRNEEGYTPVPNTRPPTPAPDDKRPPTPDRPTTPDTDETEYEERFLIETTIAAIKQARAWEGKAARGHMKTETARYIGASAAEALRGLEKRFGLDNWNREVDGDTRAWAKEMERDYWHWRAMEDAKVGRDNDLHRSKDAHSNHDRTGCLQKSSTTKPQQGIRH
ncbi:hypothetical protein BDZ91DRAFT_91785 [Kalaharituber pfeilii]|nr:hypothetical protein BDZ91DRAFT_91785 [Kalaharituber pfeilii]